MNRKLLWALLCVSFGGGTGHPRRAALSRLMSAAAATAALGLALKGTVHRTHLPLGLPVPWVSAAIAFTAFTLTGLALLSISATRSHSRFNGAFSRITATLPLTRTSRWLLTLLPPLIVALITTGLTLPITIALALDYQLPLGLELMALYAGTLAAVGYAMFTKPRELLLRAAGFAAMAGAGGYLLKAYVYQTAGMHNATLAGVFALLGLALAGLAQSFLTSAQPAVANIPDAQLVVMPPRLLMKWWFLLKILRNPRTIIATSICFGLAVIVALAIQAKHLAALGGPQWLLVGAMLTSAIACDIRGLTPRHKAPEVETLAGPAFFVRAQTQAALFVAFVPPLPMLAILLGAHIMPTAQLLGLYAGLQLAALLLGLFASTVFVPRDGDVGAQFFTVLLSSSTLFVIPRLAHFQNLEPLQQSAVWLLFALSAYLLMLLIEQSRRKHYVAI